MPRKLKGEDLHFKKCIGCDQIKNRSDFHKKGGISTNRDCRCKVCRSAINKEGYKQYIKNDGLKRNYNITLEEYNLLFLKQEGKCIICGRHQSEFKLALCVDHNHVTKVVRGLLCNKCNLGIGCFDDNLELLEKAKEYLNK